MANSANQKNNRKRRRRKRTPLGMLIKLLVLIAVGIAVFCAVKSGMDTSKKVLYPVAYEEYIMEYSEEYELDPYFVMGVIKTESNFIADAHSGYAAGLMQITEDTAAWLADKMGMDSESVDLFDPETSIKMGCYFLRYLIDKYDGNINTALVAYNAGIGNVAKWLEDEQYSDDGENLKSIPFTETRNYVERVNSAWQYYKEYYTEYYEQQAAITE